MEYVRDEYFIFPAWISAISVLIEMVEKHHSINSKLDPWSSSGKPNAKITNTNQSFQLFVFVFFLNHHFHLFFLIIFPTITGTAFVLRFLTFRSDMLKMNIL